MEIGLFLFGLWCGWCACTLWTDYWMTQHDRTDA